VHCGNPEQRMSQLGQTLTSADACGTTASPPEADMPGSPSDVAEVLPTADSWHHTAGCSRCGVWRVARIFGCR